MKRLIYQVYVPIRGESKLYNLCVDSVAKYCEWHGIDHIVAREPTLKILPDMARTGRNKNGLMKEAGYLPIYEKEQAFTYLDRYDQIAVIDADIYIRNTAPNIFNELGDHDWGGVLERDLPLAPKHAAKIKAYSNVSFKAAPCNTVEWDWNANGADFMNMGMMMFNKSIIKHIPEWQNPREFLHRPDFKDLVDGVGPLWHSTDQILLNYWLKKSGANVKHLDWKWNTLYRGATDESIPAAYFVHFFMKEGIKGKGEDIDSIRKILNI